MKVKIKGYPNARTQFSLEKEYFYYSKDFTILEVLK